MTSSFIAFDRNNDNRRVTFSQKDNKQCQNCALYSGDNLQLVKNKGDNNQGDNNIL